MASVTAVATALPSASRVPAGRLTLTPAMPFSPASRTPLLLASSHTLPDSDAASSPKSLPLEPAAGRLVRVMVLDEFSCPSARPVGCVSMMR
ncbi:hypothetical protein D9M69_669080 [compost metagenome]